MTRPWHCDGCGDLQDHDGVMSYSVTQRALRTRAEEAERKLAEAREVLAILDTGPCRFCPSNETGDPHAPDCRLAGVLGSDP